MSERSRGNAATRFFTANASGFAIVFVLAVVLALTTDTFLTPANLDSLGRQVSIYAIIAIGQLLVILTGGIDLAVGSIVGLTGIVVAQTVYETTGAGPIWFAVGVALVAGALCGLITGLLVAVLRIPPFIASLGMMGIARGVALLLSGGRTIQPLPEQFEELAGGDVFGVSNLIIVTVLVVVIASVVLAKTSWGRYVHAVGSNAESARLSGVPVKSVLVSVYMASGLLAALGGILLASRLNNGVPTAGAGYELQAIAACVIGGASLFGARGTAVGALIGALIVGMLNNGGSLLGIDPFWLQIAIGALILVAVAVDQLPKSLPGLKAKFTARSEEEDGADTSGERVGADASDAPRAERETAGVER
ncbi:ABC transporter permease [Agromyces protaetiae]|uniref:ABC transporter permease n=1 Tax=Agromyces protaetiae TaxID=2509455 RepID=A0A4P6FT41_9MICO|nr:ABC transporter permease [Agromyces protaetiae]QAY73738.1 ABC transporter permease [Agromyces protaetiae]